MKFAVVGGDERSARLCRLLLNDGHKVSSYALERAALPANVQRAGCIQACVYGADCVILPVPAERAGVPSSQRGRTSRSVSQIPFVSISRQLAIKISSALLIS